MENPQNEQAEEETPTEESESKGKKKDLDFDLGFRPAELEDLFPDGFGNFDFGF